MSLWIFSQISMGLLSAEKNSSSLNDWERIRKSVHRIKPLKYYKKHKVVNYYCRLQVYRPRKETGFSQFPAHALPSRPGAASASVWAAPGGLKPAFCAIGRNRAVCPALSGLPKRNQPRCSGANSMLHCWVCRSARLRFLTAGQIPGMRLLRS